MNLNVFEEVLVSNCMKPQNQEKLMFSNQRLMGFHCSNLKDVFTDGKANSTLLS